MKMIAIRKKENLLFINIVTSSPDYPGLCAESGV